MNNFEWLQALREVFHDFSDAEFQRKSWIHGESKKVSSFEELVCRLYDDLNFDDLLLSGVDDGVIDDKTHASLSKFSCMLGNLEELNMNGVEGYVDAESLLKDEAWKAIQKAALEVTILIDCRLRILENEG